MAEPVVEQEPAKLTPYSYLSEIQPKAETDESETTTRVGPKVKRTGIAMEPPLLGPQPTEAPGEGSSTRTPVLFPVRKWDYEVFEKIFDSSVKGTVKQTDFIQVHISFFSKPHLIVDALQAMTHIGFSLGQAEGSRFTMNHLEGSAYSVLLLDLIKPILTAANRPTFQRPLVRGPFYLFRRTIPDCYHCRRHNGDGEMSVARRHGCAKRLKEDYGWTLASFRIIDSVSPS